MYDYFIAGGAKPKLKGRASDVHNLQGLVDGSGFVDDLERSGISATACKENLDDESVGFRHEVF